MNPNIANIRETRSQQVIDDPDLPKDNPYPSSKQMDLNNPAKYTNKPQKKRLISRFFSDLSRLGMRYEDDVIANMRAVPADSSLLTDELKTSVSDLIGQANWKLKDNADKDFFSKDLNQKREALRNLAVQPELEDILDTMTDECIVYDADYTYFCEPLIEQLEIGDYKLKVRRQIQETVSKEFRKLYKMLDWKRHAWDQFKRFLVEGVMAWEIVWDSLEEPKRIIGLVPLDAATLTRSFDKNKWYWTQFKGVTGKERKLLDAQVIYIAYQETNCISRQSYLERLVRPFNIYRIIEQAQLVWTITNSSYKMQFTIPIKGQGEARGRKTLASAMNQYREDIKFQTDTGELKINGQSTMPFNKEYWMPESESGSPQIQVLGGDGPQLNDSDQLMYFKNVLYKISKIPPSRFDEQAGSTWFGTDPTQALRSEISFGRFVNRLRNTWAEVILKPLRQQLAIDIPEIANDQGLMQAIGLQYKSYNLFEEMMELELQQKRIDFVSGIKDSLNDMDANGVEIKFFSSKFLVQKYLHYSDQDLVLNAKLKKEEQDEWSLAGGKRTDAIAGINIDGDGEETPAESVNSETPLRLDISDLATIIENLSPAQKGLLLEQMGYNQDGTPLNKDTKSNPIGFKK